MFMAHEPQMPAGTQMELSKEEKQDFGGEGDSLSLLLRIARSVCPPEPEGKGGASLTFSAGPAESQGGIHFILDLDQGIQDHGATPGTRTRQLPERGGGTPALLFSSCPKGSLG